LKRDYFSDAFAKNPDTFKKPKPKDERPFWSRVWQSIKVRPRFNKKGLSGWQITGGTEF